MNSKFTDNEFEALTYIVSKLVQYDGMNPITSPITFDWTGTFKQFQTLADKKLVFSSFKPSYGNPIRPLKHYWWYLTSEGSELINTMKDMREL
ncbi:hypothetical protein KAU11_09710 [Candidatus Babeliales bacterium]|nr:hypothetical protein [Candidatus Babeliales bacterium]